MNDWDKFVYKLQHKMLTGGPQLSSRVNNLIIPIPKGRLQRRLLRKVWYFLRKIKVWQPWPYYGYNKDAPISIWFNRRVKGCDGAYEWNWLKYIWEMIF